MLPMLPACSLASKLLTIKSLQISTAKDAATAIELLEHTTAAPASVARLSHVSKADQTDASN